MAKFKIGDKVVMSDSFYWFKMAEQMMRDNGFLVIFKVFEFSEQEGGCAYLMQGIPFILFSEEWLEPYIDQAPSPPNPGRPAYMPQETYLPKEEFSVRDRFAMAALMCLKADDFISEEYVAEKAYWIADAMMERRKK